MGHCQGFGFYREWIRRPHRLNRGVPVTLLRGRRAEGRVQGLPEKPSRRRLHKSWRVETRVEVGEAQMP